MNDESEVEEVPWRPYFRDTRPPRYWCAPLALLLFFGFLTIGGTIFIFVMGYDPRPIDWRQYAFYILGTIAAAHFSGLSDEKEANRNKSCASIQTFWF